VDVAVGIFFPHGFFNMLTLAVAAFNVPTIFTLLLVESLMISKVILPSAFQTCVPLLVVSSVGVDTIAFFSFVQLDEQVHDNMSNVSMTLFFNGFELKKRGKNKSPVDGLVYRM
jgi:hypothetical protein